MGLEFPSVDFRPEYRHADNFSIGGITTESFIRIKDFLFTLWAAHFKRQDFPLDLFSSVACAARWCFSGQNHQFFVWSSPICWAIISAACP